MTAAQRGVVASILFLVCATLAGIVLEDGGTAYRTFQLPEGVFALLLTYILVQRGAWIPPAGALGWMALAYGTLANAQVLELLFPPPGVIQWSVAGALAIAAWGALGQGSRHRLVVSLASLALLLALLKFSVIPVLWSHAGPAAGTAFGLGDLAEGARRLAADHRPVRPAGQLVGFAALCFWCLATHLLWLPGVNLAAPIHASSGDGDGEDDE
jgi:hypothetical protein